MMANKLFIERLHFLTKLIYEISNELISEEALLRLTEQHKKWFGFHTPTGLVIGAEKRLAKMGLRSMLCYQIYLNVQLSIGRSRTELENTLLMCLADCAHEGIFVTVAQENPDKASQINSTIRDNLVIKADEGTGEWWLLLDEHKSPQAV